MKNSRGRHTLYQLLAANQDLPVYLPETTIFTKKTFVQFMEKYSEFIIKPVFGPSEIHVCIEDKQAEILLETGETLITRIEKAYGYIVKGCLKSCAYLMQSTIRCQAPSAHSFFFYITVHRSQSGWYVISRTSKYPISPTSYSDKGDELAVRVAKALEPFYPDCSSIVIEIGMLHDYVWIQDTVLHLHRSKWSQYHSLNGVSGMSSYLPETNLLTHHTLKSYFAKYTRVVLKPCYGQQGKGVLFISKHGDSGYEIHGGRKKLKKANTDELYAYLNRHYLSKEEYLIQQWIPLATVNGCPIDLRIVVEKMNGKWRIQGKIAKIALKDYLVTNVAEKLLSVGHALRQSSIAHLHHRHIEVKVEQLALYGAKCLEGRKVGISLIGFDIGVSEDGDVWMIDGNENPDLTMFARSDDQDVFWKGVGLDR